MSHHHRAIAPALALTLALAATTAPVASADPAPLPRAETAIANTPTRPSASPAPCGDVCSGHGYGGVDVVALGPSVRPTSTATPHGGFDWGDAGAGAGAMIVLLLIGTGGVLATSTRRSRRVEQQHASASS